MALSLNPNDRGYVEHHCEIHYCRLGDELKWYGEIKITYRVTFPDRIQSYPDPVVYTSPFYSTQAEAGEGVRNWLKQREVLYFMGPIMSGHIG